MNEVVIMAAGMSWYSVLAWGGVIIVILLVAAWAVKYLGINSIGPVKREQFSQSDLYSLNSINDDLDEMCKRNLRSITSRLRSRFNNLFDDQPLCGLARRAISSSLRFPLYESISNNHFTTELTGDHYVIYRERIIDLIKDEYDDMVASSKYVSCDMKPLLKWDDAYSFIVKNIDFWLNEVCREVSRTVHKKLDNYNTYLEKFREHNDIYRIKIIDECIAKNERYIKDLNKHMI